MTNDNDPWIVQLRKGTLELCILALLYSHEYYGYQIAQGLTYSAGLTVSEGTIYPLLSRLQREGLVVAEWRESQAGPPRKYYRLTLSGRQELAGKISAWQQLSQSVNGIVKEVGNDERTA